MTGEEMKNFIEAYRIATVKVIEKLYKENADPFLHGFIDTEKSIAYIKSQNDS